LKGAGTSAITTATAGTDYAPATSGTSILKGNGSGGFSNAASGTDYAPATSGTAILKGNGTGGFSNAAAGTDYAAATTGTSAQLLANNGSGGFSNVTVGSGLSLSAGTLSNTASVSAATPTTLGTVYGNTPSAGTYGTFLGYQAGNVTTGIENVAVGYQTLDENTTGIENTAVGYTALTRITTGAGNIGIGRRAGAQITTGSQNICIGNSPGDYVNYLTTGSQNILIGYGTQPSATSGANQVVIGTGLGVQGKGDNSFFVNPNGGGAYNGGNTTTWTTTSDQRIKKNIVDNTQGLSLLNQIRVRNFEYRLPEEVDGGLLPSDAVKKEGIQLGVIAQEIQQVLPDCVTSETTGVLSVNSDNLIWYAINAIKELSTRLQAAEAEIATLKGA
jgi:hypothetical protein